MSPYILAAAAVILACLLLNRVSGKLGVPTLALFILLGMFSGSDGVLKIHFDDFAITERISTVALIFIMFYGGFGTSWRQARPVAFKAGLLASLGVAFTALFVGLFCRLALGLSWLESMLVGSVISSTDAASVFSILRSKKLNLKYGTASMLEMESGSNDPCSYMLTIIVLSLMHGQFSLAELPFLLIRQVALGVGLGFAAGALASYLLMHLRIKGENTDAILVFAMALTAYAGADYLGGNGFLSVYICGIYMGNSPLPGKKALVGFFDGVTGLMQMLLFFLLGLLSFPSQLPQVFLPGLATALFLTFVARPLATFVLLAPFRCPWQQQALVAWAGLRGAASIVFAIMATVHPAQVQNDVFHLTFFIVLFSIFSQGSLLPFMSRKLHMIDAKGDVMKTFSDYSDEIPVDFIKINVGEKHPWAGRRISEVELVPELLLAMIMRGGEQVLPRGDTVVLPGDRVVLTALSLESSEGLVLTEHEVGPEDEWKDRSLREAGPSKNSLVVAVLRGEEVLIPHGSTVLREGDVLISSQINPAETRRICRRICR